MSRMGRPLQVCSEGHRMCWEGLNRECIVLSLSDSMEKGCWREGVGGRLWRVD